MDVVILEDPAEVGAHTAALIVRRAVEKPKMVLGIATGSSPLKTYRELARLRAQGTVNFDGMRCFALDEYVGLPHQHPASYATVVAQEVTTALGLEPANVSTPDGMASDLYQACQA